MMTWKNSVDLQAIDWEAWMESESWLRQYIGRCKLGLETVGIELMQMLDLHVEDLFDHNLRYDTEQSDVRIKFIEAKCKFYEAPFAGKPFIMTLRQKAFIEAVYSFKMYDEELGRWARLYQDVLLLIARKGGKTPLIAAMMLAEWFCGLMGTRCLCSSNDHEQAALMLDAIDAMREESSSLERVTRKNNTGIYFGNRKQKNKKGKFSRQNKGSIKKISANKLGKEGRNIAVGAADEVHELKDNSSIMPIRQALSTQHEPLFFEITTEGFVADGYLDARLQEARQKLAGELDRPRWLTWLYTQDSETEIWQDEQSWLKSNPDLGVIKKWSFLRQMLEESKTNSATRAYVLAKDFNIKQAGGAAWLQDAEIINTATFALEDFRGAYYIAGHDFAETTDLMASKALLVKPDDPTVYFWSHYWIPETKLVDAPDDADYERWAREGYLTIVPGGSVESSLAAEWQWKLYEEFEMVPFKSGYDDRYAKDYLARYQEYFGDRHEAVNVPQRPSALNNPTRRLESDLRHKLVNYNNRYGDYWCIRNAVLRMDTAERVMLAKSSPTARIDGAAAGVVCYAIFGWHKSEFMELVGGR